MKKYHVILDENDVASFRAGNMAEVQGYCDAEGMILLGSFHTKDEADFCLETRRISDLAEDLNCEADWNDEGRVAIRFWEDCYCPSGWWNSPSPRDYVSPIMARSILDNLATIAANRAEEAAIANA